MYLHLGSETIINTKNIVGIFDLDNTTHSKFTKNYLTKVQKENKVVNVSYELPKSFIICYENNLEKVYISQISAQTLLKRMQSQYKI